MPFVLRFYTCPAPLTGSSRRHHSPWAPLAAALCCTWAVAAFDATRPTDAAGDVPRTASERVAADSSLPLTDAERIARLQRGIEDGQAQLRRLRTAIDAPDSEYSVAESEFAVLDRERDAARKALQDAVGAGADAAEIERRKSALEELESRWRIARQRFDLAISERKAQTAQIAALERKLQQDGDAIRRLKGEPATQPAASQPSSAEAAEAPSPAPAAGPSESPQDRSTPATPPSAPPASVVPAPSLISPPSIEETQELAAAREEASRKSVAAAEAEEEARSVEERIRALRESILLEQTLLDTARQRARNAREAEALQETELESRWNSRASAAEISDVRSRLGEERKRLQEAEREVASGMDRIGDLQTELADVQAEHIAALEKAAAVRREAQTAQRRVERLESPLAPHNLWRWLVERGPRVGGIIVGMAAVILLARLAEGRIVALLTLRGDHGPHEERENRARTLVGVFHSATSVAVYAGGALMILTELGVNIVPLMGGAAVIGLAVAFGAQNLIRDYFTGFMILLENQYGINDVVRIGALAGQVERITLRVTVLRDLEGAVHFIPNGQITSVTNMTHGWSRAMLDISVAYHEDVDRVMNVLIELAKELRRDPEYRGMILETPEMLGVERLGESAVVVRLLLKTRPLRQWQIRREMLRRVKQRFGELGIEIPLPQRVVYHRNASAGIREVKSQ